MNTTDILSLALTSLAVLVAIHLSVFWVVKTMFPPVAPLPPAPAPVAPAPAPVAPVYVQPPETRQEIHVPTYEPPVQMETPRKEIPGTTDIEALNNSPPV
jgi:hypothetical protein